MSLHLSPRRWGSVLGSVGLAAAAYLGFSLWGGWHEVVAAMAQVGAGGLLLLLALSLVNYGLRFARWQVLLGQFGPRPGHGRSLGIYLAGFALTTTPGKAGEAVRSVFLKPLGVAYTHSMAAFLCERLSDLSAVLCLALLGIQAFPSLRPLVVVAALGLVGLWVLLAHANLLEALQQRSAQRPGRLARVLTRVAALLLSARACHRPRVLALTTLLSLVAWAAEAWALHLLLGWLGLSTDWTFSFFVYAIGLVAGALSFMPGGLGGTEAVMVWVLLAHGAAQPAAVAATVLIRLTTLWFAVALGLPALAWQLRHVTAEPGTELPAALRP